MPLIPLETADLPLAELREGVHGGTDRTLVWHDLTTARPPSAAQPPHVARCRRQRKPEGGHHHDRPRTPASRTRM